MQSPEIPQDADRVANRAQSIQTQPRRTRRVGGASHVGRDGTRRVTAHRRRQDLLCARHGIGRYVETRGSPGFRFGLITLPALWRVVDGLGEGGLDGYLQDAAVQTVVQQAEVLSARWAA